MTELAHRAARPTSPVVSCFRALVVVQNPFIRAQIVRRMLLQGAGEVIEAGSTAEARARAAITGALELSVIDAHLPDGSGADLVGELSALGWQRGLLLSPDDDLWCVQAALNAGVRAFLVSSCATPALSSTARIGGDAPAGHGRHNGQVTGPAALSLRELEVLRLVADGHRNKDIGAALGLSVLTVKSHLSRIAQKVGTGERAEIVMIALRGGVIT